MDEGERESLARKASADRVLERAASELEVLLKEASAALRPFPSFPNAFFTNAIECDPGPAGDPAAVAWWWARTAICTSSSRRRPRGGGANGTWDPVTAPQGGDAAAEPPPARLRCVRLQRTDGDHGGAAGAGRGRGGGVVKGLLKAIVVLAVAGGVAAVLWRLVGVRGAARQRVNPPRRCPNSTKSSARSACARPPPTWTRATSTSTWGSTSSPSSGTRAHLRRGRVSRRRSTTARPHTRAWASSTRRWRTTTPRSS